MVNYQTDNIKSLTTRQLRNSCVARQNQLSVQVKQVDGTREAIAGLRYIYPNEESYFTCPDLIDMNHLMREFNIHIDDRNELQRRLRLLSLSDENGIPMHCIDNGYYYVQEANSEARHTTPLSTDKEVYTNAIARHLRITKYEAAGIVNTCKSKEDFRLVVAMFYDKWKIEANECLDLIRKIKGSV